MMETSSRPKTVTFILSMLILLVVVSALSLGNGLAFGGGFSSGGGRQFSGTPRVRETPGPGTPQAQAGTGSGTPTAGRGNFPGSGGGGGGNFPGNGGTGGNTGGNFQGRGNQGFSMFTIIRALGLPFQVIGIINIAIPIIGLLLLLTSLYGVWKSKRWGLNLATLLALIFLIGGIMALSTSSGRAGRPNSGINWFSLLNTGGNILNLVASLPILALSFLPSVRDYFPKSEKK